MTNDHLDSFESDKYVCNALNVMAMFCIDVDYYYYFIQNGETEENRTFEKWNEMKECIEWNFNQECNVERGA